MSVVVPSPELPYIQVATTHIHFEDCFVCALPGCLGKHERSPVRAEYQPTLELTVGWVCTLVHWSAFCTLSEDSASLFPSGAHKVLYCCCGGLEEKSKHTLYRGFKSKRNIAVCMHALDCLESWNLMQIMLDLQYEHTQRGKSLSKFSCCSPSTEDTVWIPYSLILLLLF